MTSAVITGRWGSSHFDGGCLPYLLGVKKVVLVLLGCVSLIKSKIGFLNPKESEKGILRFGFPKQISPRSLGSWYVKGTEESTQGVDKKRIKKVRLRPQNRILVPPRGSFQNFRRASPSFL